MQPQPEFQKREQMKKRRQRRKSDISKMDLTELRRKLERKMVCNGWIRLLRTSERELWSHFSSVLSLTFKDTMIINIKPLKVLMLIVIRLRIIPKGKNQMLKILERTQQRLMADFMMVPVVHQILDHLVKMPEVRHLLVTICLVICQPEVIQVILAWSHLLFKRLKICLKAQLRTQKRKTEIQILLKAS